MYAHYFRQAYHPPEDPGALSVEYEYWRVNDPAFLADGHVAVAVHFEMSPDEQETIYLDAGILGQLQGNLGGANYMFLPDDIPDTFTPDGSYVPTMAYSFESSNETTTSPEEEEQSWWEATIAALEAALRHQENWGYDPLTNGGYGPGH